MLFFVYDNEACFTSSQGREHEKISTPFWGYMQPSVCVAWAYIWHLCKLWASEERDKTRRSCYLKLARPSRIAVILFCAPCALHEEADNAFTFTRSAFALKETNNLKKILAF